MTALVLTIQLILQLKIFDQIYLMTQGGPFNSTYVVVQYIYKQASRSITAAMPRRSRWRCSSSSSVSVLQFQLLGRGRA